MTPRRHFHVNEFYNVQDNMALRWGIAPVSHLADDFASALSLLPESHHQIVSCVGTFRSHALAFADKYNVPNVYTSFEDLARCPEVDVVYISPLNPLHCELCNLMLNHDKHVLCEKPLCMAEDQVNKLLKKAQAKKLFLMEGMWPRCVPAYHYLRRQIMRNTYGEIFQVQCTLGVPIPQSRLLMYGGVTKDLGIYGLQLALWVFREVPQSIKTTGKLNGEDIDVSAEIELTFSRQRHANILVSAVEELPNQAVIRGTKGSVNMNNYWCPTRLSDSNNTDIEFPLPHSEIMTHYHNRLGMCYEAEEVRQCISSGRTESEFFNQNESLLLANLTDTIHELLGVRKRAVDVDAEEADVISAGEEKLWIMEPHSMLADSAINLLQKAVKSN